MSLTDVLTLPPDDRKPNIKVDLMPVVGKPHVVEFREPRLADLFPDAKVVERLRVSHPHLAVDHVNSCVVMGRCYIKGDDENALEPVRAMCRIAENNETVFLALMREFATAYLIDFGQQVKNEGND